MNRHIYLYTPWREQGLSYDAKVIENIALQHGFKSIITYRTKKKIEWDCEYLPIKKVVNELTSKDIFFSFEVFPEQDLNLIKTKTDNLYHMVNYEYYKKEKLKLHNLFKKIFCKSLIAYKGCHKDGLDNIIYMPWILYDFPVYEYKPISSNNIIKVLFNGGSGGYKERRNLESIMKLINNYSDKDIFCTIKLTKDVQKWTKNILTKYKQSLNKDKRIKIVQKDLSRLEYIDFLYQFDINLAPSKFEGYGLTILEALHLNMPTITLNVSPMNEIIKHNKTGLCMKAVCTDYLNDQPINEVLPEIFHKSFSTLVKNNEKITEMKKNIYPLLIRSNQRFNNYFHRVFSGKSI